MEREREGENAQHSLLVRMNTCPKIRGPEEAIEVPSPGPWALVPAPAHQRRAGGDVQAEEVGVDGVEVAVELLDLLHALVHVGQGHGAQRIPAHDGAAPGFPSLSHGSLVRGSMGHNVGGGCRGWGKKNEHDFHNGIFSQTSQVLSTEKS